VWRQVPLERLDSALCLHLLDEREGRVEGDHRDDRRGEHGRTRDQREHRGSPQEKRQRMRELTEELTRPATARAPGEFVASKRDEPPASFAFREPVTPCPQVTEKHLDGLRRVERFSRCFETVSRGRRQGLARRTGKTVRH
jgi:hypothetical protein